MGYANFLQVTSDYAIIYVTKSLPCRVRISSFYHYTDDYKPSEALKVLEPTLLRQILTKNDLRAFEPCLGYRVALGYG